MRDIVEHPDHLVAHREFVESLDASRRPSHLVASAPGLYLLNLLALTRPERLTVFDADATELKLFTSMRGIVLSSTSAEDWLRRLRSADLGSEETLDPVLTEGLARLAGCADTRDPHAPHRRWSLAIERFEALRASLEEVEVELRHEAATDPAFKSWLSRQENAWTYLGCLHQQLRADSFTFEHPRNTVLFFANPRKVDDRAALDLDAFQERAPLRIHCKNVRRISNPIWYRRSEDTPGLDVRVSPHPMDRFWYLDTERATPLYREIADIVKSYPYKKILEVGCRHGRVTEFLDESYSFLGFDIVAPAIRRAREKVARRAPAADFRFVEGDWHDPPDAEAEVIIFGGVFHYIRDRLAFFQRYLDKYDPSLVIIADIQATDLSKVNDVYPWSDKRTLYLQIKRRYRVIHTFPIRS